MERDRPIVVDNIHRHLVRAGNRTAEARQVRDFGDDWNEYDEEGRTFDYDYAEDYGQG